MGTHIFDTPYDRRDAMNGEECNVLKHFTRESSAGLDHQLVLIEFSNGAKAEVWPEEIHEKGASCPSESSPTPPPSARETT